MAVPSATMAWGVPGQGGEPLRKPLLFSAAAHVLLASLSLLGVLLGYRNGGWGEGGPGGAAVVRLVSAASVPLPAPTVATNNRLATENPGLHRPEPVPETPRTRRGPTPPPPTPEKAVELPGRNARRIASTSQPPAPPSETRASAAPPPRPQPRSRNAAPEAQLGNEIPFGEGGPAQGPYGIFSTDSGTGGLTFSGGAGDFGARYGWYVSAIRNRISNNWLKSTVDPGVRVAPRVYVTFQILRDGQIVNAQLTAASGVASLDRSALRAVFDSNPMPSLPADYAGSNVAVEFWFDFRR